MFSVAKSNDSDHFSRLLDHCHQIRFYSSRSTGESWSFSSSVNVNTVIIVIILNKAILVLNDGRQNGLGCEIQPNQL